MFAPSVRKEYLRRSQQANAASQQAYQAYEAARKHNAAGLAQYYAARDQYEKALRAFGQDRFDQLARGIIKPTPADTAQIQHIGKLCNHLMAVADQFAVAIDHVQRLYNAFQACVTKEKARPGTCSTSIFWTKRRSRKKRTRRHTKVEEGIARRSLQEVILLSALSLNRRVS